MGLKLTGPIQPPLAGGKPRSLVVLLHGYGSDGNDLISLSPLWANALPNTLFISPHAPFPCEMGPFGRQWFSLSSFESTRVLAGLQEATPILNNFLDQLLLEHGLADETLALAGFSQGTMLALYAGLRRPRPLAGIVGFSGALYGGENLQGEIQARPPVLLVHGEEDGVVPFQALASAEARLKSVGVPVQAYARPGLAHGIDEEGIGLAREFLRSVLNKATAGGEFGD